MIDANQVAEHYATPDLLGRIDAALARAGCDPLHVAWPDLAAVDQFHVRGLAATKDLVEALGATEGDSVIDVGSGLGGPSRYLAATRGCHVTGIDLAPEYVAAASVLAERAGLSSLVKYQQANALDLPFADASFDHALTQHVAMNIAAREQLYGSIRRVLRPGGRLAIYDVVKGNDEPLKFPVPWARGPEISFLLTGDAMRDVLAKTGFTELSWDDQTDNGIAWFERQRAALEAADAPPPLGVNVILGAQFREMAANLTDNLRAGRVRLVQTVVQWA
ncbi:MAG: class I SAM-dependent methyltransferase [Gemmatimonadaceae bacterium]